MNFRTASHLARTEIRRNLWLIITLWLLFFVPYASVLVALTAILLAARIALSLHPARSTAHWRIRPTSRSDRCAALTILTTVLFVAPALLHQAWLGASCGFDAGAIWWGLLEVLLVTLIVVNAAFTVATIAGSEPRTAILVIALILLSILTVLILDAIDFDFSSDLVPPGVQGEISQVPNPIVWWTAWLTTLGMALAASAFYTRIQRRRPAIVLLFAATALSVTLFLWASQNDFPFRPCLNPDSPHLTLVQVPPGSDNDNPQQQRLHSDVAIVGLPEATFVDIQHRNRFGSGPEHWHYAFPAHESSLNSNFARTAFWRTLPNEHRVLSAYSLITLPSTAQGPIDPLRPAPGEDATQQLSVNGAVFRWTELGEMPFVDNDQRLGHDFFARLRKIPHQPETETPHRSFQKSYRLTLIRPNLTLSPSPSEFSGARAHSSMRNLVVVAEHRALRESLVLLLRTEGEWTTEVTISYDVFGLQKNEIHELEIHTNEHWRILFPTGDPTAQWLAGAKLKVYMTEYLGPFHDSIVPDPAKESHR